MCGINGVITWHKNVKNSVQGMNDKIFHRGPDSEGIYTYVSPNNYHIQMGMRRLAIIDLQEGDQPIFTTDKSVCILYNGEIYNFKSIRASLISEGVKFQTHSDTEVILQLYVTRGVEGFSMLDGMFAISIHDQVKDKLILARDYFGEKPLYLYHDDNKIIWSSELKSLIPELGYKPEIDPYGLNLFLRLTYIPAPYTIYKNVQKVRSNTTIEIDLSTKEFSIQDISKFEVPEVKKKISFESAKKEVKRMVEDSVLQRSVSDVPIGTFLSGGVDSSIVTLSLAKLNAEPINTFSVGFNKKEFDESEKAEIIAKKINSKHHSFILQPNDIKDDLTTILNNFDEPFADSSALPSYFIAKKTAQHIKVVLTGDGGDEVFGGYNKYQMGSINKLYTRNIPSALHKNILKFSKPFLSQKDDSRGLRFKINKALNAIDYKSDYYYKILSLGFTNNAVEILKPHYFIESPFKMLRGNNNVANSISDFREIDRITSLEGDMLVKVDRTCMLNSLEARAPFLNKSLWDYTMQLPDNYLINKRSKKHILKKAFEREFPENFLELKKQGFGIPVGDWLKQSLKEELLSYINIEFLKQQNIFNANYTVKLVSDHINEKMDNTFQVWTFYCFQKWYCDIYQNISG